eukprot:scaffold2472_cov132-Skeletonema_menzelii.AAC.8
MTKRKEYIAGIYELVKAENNELKEQVWQMQDHIQFLKDQLQCQNEEVKELEEKIKQNSNE